MCELLVCVKDLSKGRIGLPEEGDVIEVKENGSTWGAAELGFLIAGNPWGNHPHLRLFKAPNITVADASRLLTPQIGADPTVTPRFRGFYLDKTKVSGALLAHWIDDARKNSFITVPYSATQLDSIVTER